MRMKSVFSGLRRIFILSIFLSNPAFSAQTLSGTVKDGSGKGINGATVQLVVIGKSTLTDSAGNWQLDVSSSIQHQTIQNGLYAAAIRNGMLVLTILQPRIHVKVSLHKVDGTLLDWVLDKQLASGLHTLNPIRQSLPPQLVLLKADIGGKVTYFRIPLLAEPGAPASNRGKKSAAPLAKTGAVIDTLKAAKSGYQTAAKPIESYASGPHQLVLTEALDSYRLPPPDACNAWDYVQGCIPGDPNSVCGGVCATINACSESQTSKPGADVTFVCPRTMLHSTNMLQAAIDDGNEAYLYGIVGHDVDAGFIDGNAKSTCCQCYQMVYAWPSPNNERQVQKNPDDVSKPASAVPIPKPIIAQSFNTAATRNTFDIYMGGGGFGAHNGCGPGLQQTSTSGQYLYEGYPQEGGISGGVKPITHWSECKNQYQWVTEESLRSPACQARLTETCNKITHADPKITEYARKSCIQTSQPASLHHANWSVYVRMVECPEALTRVTGCKLQPQGLPKVNGLITAEQAANDPSFWKKGSNGNMYETTTMEDCCRPSCAAANWVQEKGLKTDPEYNVFYSCDRAGVPFTQPKK
jgi:hypothetical protein